MELWTRTEAEVAQVICQAVPGVRAVSTLNGVVFAHKKDPVIEYRVFTIDFTFNVVA
jgi:hypothetical protein